MAINQQSLFGSYVETTAVLDVISKLEESNVSSPEFREALVRLTQIVNNIALVLNNKVSGMYLLESFVNGATLYSTTNNPATLRPVQTITINTGALGAGMTTVNLPSYFVPASTWNFLRISGGATKTSTPIFYALPNGDIEVYVTTTTLVIVNGSGVAFDSSNVILEYTQN